MVVVVVLHFCVFSALFGVDAATHRIIVASSLAREHARRTAIGTWTLLLPPQTQAFCSQNKKAGKRVIETDIVLSFSDTYIAI